MKLFVKTITLIIIALLALNACSGASKTTGVADNIIGTEWRLTEIQTKPRPIILNRNSPEIEGFFENIFTLNFDVNSLGGIGAPNRYSAPYRLGENRTITIQPMAATLMAPIRELENLKENVYFSYLQNAYKWDISKGKLRLHTKSEAGIKAILIYDLIVK